MFRYLSLLLLFVTLIVVFLSVCDRIDKKRSEQREKEGSVSTDDESARSRHLLEAQRRLQRQIADSDEVVERLIAGRISLAGAIDELDLINANRPTFDPRTSRITRPGMEMTRPELLACYALRKASERQCEPSRGAELIARLRADFKALFGYEWSSSLEQSNESGQKSLTAP